MDDFPLPGMGEMNLAVPAPAQGSGWGAEASSAALNDDGSFVIPYRVRTGQPAADRPSWRVRTTASIRAG